MHRLGVGTTRDMRFPIHILIGRHDHTVNHDLALDFFLGLSAPQKSFHTFEHSAHSPLFEEPERARQILLEAFHGT